MKIEFVYGPFSTGGKVFNFERLMEDQQGLTGSEVSCFYIAQAMAKRGHEVVLYAKVPDFMTPGFDWKGVSIRHLHLFGEPRPIPQVAYSWNEPSLMKYVNHQTLRIVNQQLNDWMYCHKEPFDQWVDVFTSPSQKHLEYLVGLGETTPSKWRVIPNGCDPSMFDLKMKRNPGTVMYASSPDRGLHLLLQCWPEIRAAVPDATLKIFYSFDHWFSLVNGMGADHCEDIKETVARAQYISYAFDRMKKGCGIQHHKSVSKIRLAREMSQTQVLGYSFSPLRWTEGFSVTTLEACASGMLPIISSEDALGDIYGSAVPMIEAPIRDRLDKFIELVVKGLTDEAWRSQQAARCIEFAQDFTWDKIAEKLDKVILEGMEMKK